MPSDRKREIEERLPPVASPLPGEGPTETGDRNLSAGVPPSPAAEPGAGPGISSATPTPSVMSSVDEDRGTASRSNAPLPPDDSA